MRWSKLRGESRFVVVVEVLVEDLMNQEKCRALVHSVQWAHEHIPDTYAFITSS